MRPRISFALAGLLILSLAVACFADTQERVAPPEDSDAFHLSVVGIVNNAEYQRVLSWFQTDEDLAALRRSVHFHPVKAGSAIYEERYAQNIHGLPTIRLQNGQGGVLYESWGANVPKSADALASAIEAKTNQLFDPPLLPWRRNMQQKCGPGDGCGPQGCPQRELTPEDLMESDFGPPLPEFTAPVEPEPQGVPVWLCVVLALVSAGGGFVGAVVGSVKKEMAG
jgi:hypothetical protein